MKAKRVREHEPIRFAIERHFDFARANSLTWADFRVDLVNRIVHEILERQKPQRKARPR